jgi:hypothetical protein
MAWIRKYRCAGEIFLFPRRGRMGDGRGKKIQVREEIIFFERTPFFL